MLVSAQVARVINVVIISGLVKICASTAAKDTKDAYLATNFINIAIFAEMYIGLSKYQNLGVLSNVSLEIVFVKD